MNDFDFENEIIEISNEDNGDTREIDVINEIEEKVTKNSKKSLKEKWIQMPKKKRIFIISLSVLFLLTIIFLAVYFVFFNDKTEPKKEEPVIVEKDNYRYEDGKLIFLDKNEKELGSYTCDSKDSKKCYVAKLDYSNDSFDRIKRVNENLKEIEKTSKIYLDNFVFVSDSNKIKLYDIEKNEELLEVTSIKAYDTQKELVVIEKDGKYGLIEITADGYQYLIRCSYDNLGIVNNELELLVAQDGEKTYIIDSGGKVLSKNIAATIKSVNEEFIIAAQNKSYSLYNYDYEELLSDYDYISLHDNIIALVKSNRIYLRDENLSKLSEDGIRLENSDYIKSYVYDENNKLVKTKKAYDIEVNDNIVTINVGNDSTKINITEGKISSSLNYVSYYDGKIYFYSDEEKEDLIGVYNCANKNILKDSDSILSNCKVYNNDKGTSGIYNNEYVFIYDNPSISEGVIYLYDIRGKEKKGTYANIEIINASEIDNNIKQIYTSSSYIVAKSATGNNKGNYGVLEITGEKVAGKVGFKYQNISKVKNYYLLINVDKSYSIYDMSFKKISNEFSYIEIYDNYYVGIKDGKFNVYRYDNALGILESDLNITGNEFEIDFTNGFNITIHGTTYNYDIAGKVVEGE